MSKSIAESIKQHVGLHSYNRRKHAHTIDKTELGGDREALRDVINSAEKQRKSLDFSVNESQAVCAYGERVQIHKLSSWAAPTEHRRLISDATAISRRSLSHPAGTMCCTEIEFPRYMTERVGHWQFAHTKHALIRNPPGVAP